MTGHLPVSSSTGQHLVYAVDVEGMESHADVKLVLPAVLDHVLVGTDAAGLQCLAGELLVLIRDHVDAQGKVVHWRLLGPKVKYADLWVWWRGVSLTEVQLLYTDTHHTTPHHTTQTHTTPHKHTHTPHKHTHTHTHHTTQAHTHQRTWHSSTEPGLGVGLVLTVPVARGREGREGEPREE